MVFVHATFIMSEIISVIVSTGEGGETKFIVSLVEEVLQILLNICILPCKFT